VRRLPNPFAVLGPARLGPLLTDEAGPQGMAGPSPPPTPPRPRGRRATRPPTVPRPPAYWVLRSPVGTHRGLRPTCPSAPPPARTRRRAARTSRVPHTWRTASSCRAPGPAPARPCRARILHGRPGRLGPARGRRRDHRRCRVRVRCWHAPPSPGTLAGVLAWVALTMRGGPGPAAGPVDLRVGYPPPSAAFPRGRDCPAPRPAASRAPLRGRRNGERCAPPGPARPLSQHPGTYPGKPPPPAPRPAQKKARDAAPRKDKDASLNRPLAGKMKEA